MVAFVGHMPPKDAALYEFIHRRGARCMIGTSRNRDRKIVAREIADIQALEAGYRTFLGRGADLIETDIPVPLGKIAFRCRAGAAALARGFAGEIDAPRFTAGF